MMPSSFISLASSSSFYYDFIGLDKPFSESQLLDIEDKSKDLDLSMLFAESIFSVCSSKQLDQESLNRLSSLLSAQLDLNQPGKDINFNAGQQRSQILIVPRLGTVSPYSSRATDIAKHCGLLEVTRIEKSTRYHIAALDQAQPLSIEVLALLAEKLHDPMLESVLFDKPSPAEIIFADHFKAADNHHIRLFTDGKTALEEANIRLGLALSEDEQAYLLDLYKRKGRDATEAELMMFAQANSEHCRHKIFNAHWTLNGVDQTESLFGMIRQTHEACPQETVVAYSDNAAILTGKVISRFYPDRTGRYAFHQEDTGLVIKVETHNHPTAISPYPGSATGSGGEIRDEGATGRGAKPKAGLSGFAVSNLQIPSFEQPWEEPLYCLGRPQQMSSALDIMLQAPLGSSSFNNEFGRPTLGGFFRTYQQKWAGQVRGFHKPIMIAGGVGNINLAQSHKIPFSAGTALIQLGGPGMLIGLGGGAASSIDAGINKVELDFASVQRSNPEMQRRAQEVIDRCWQMGEDNPILAIHDVGAGGLANAMPELVHDAAKGARLDFAKIPLAQAGLSDSEAWCNEAQERYVLAISESSIEMFFSLCAKEKCPAVILGTATNDQVFKLFKKEEPVIEMTLADLLANMPRLHRNAMVPPPSSKSFDFTGIHLEEALQRVLRLPAVASKSFLLTIGDRTVGGLSVRDPFVGAYQVPVADVAVTAMGFGEPSGECFAMGERPPLALIDPAASVRMAIAESISNLVAADVACLEAVKLSANWMAAAEFDSEDGRLFQAVQAAKEFCIDSGLSIPVGKDSLSMRTKWKDQHNDCHEVISPLSAVISAFSKVGEVSKTLTPVLYGGASSQTELILIDLGQGLNRLGGSALAQVYNNETGGSPDISPDLLKRFFKAVRELAHEDLILAYHDRSDGGLWACVLEMAFAGHVGITLELDALCFNHHYSDVDSSSVMSSRWFPRPQEEAMIAALLSEEIGAVIQAKVSSRQMVFDILRKHGLGSYSTVIGRPNDRDSVQIYHEAQLVYQAQRADLQRLWSETSYQLNLLRDEATCAQEEWDALLKPSRTCLSVSQKLIESAYVDQWKQEESRPPAILTRQVKAAVLREQGVNGQVELAAAFYEAGCDVIDISMTDLMEKRQVLKDFNILAVSGGFSYGDVLGAGQGWAKSILFNPFLADEFSHFFERANTLTLGVCNGCQMLSHLKSLIPGTKSWPRFVQNKSRQFEARLSNVRIRPSPSLFLQDMDDWSLPIVVSHGEGRTIFDSGQIQHVESVLEYVDGQGNVAQCYPENPNGSQEGIAGVATKDGRVTIMMPHPERCFQTNQLSWHPEQWKQLRFSPWFEMFKNARKALLS